MVKALILLLFCIVMGPNHDFHYLTTVMLLIENFLL